ncbi:MAG: VIT1/CCC1 transporter family protein [Stigonema ocellatum SAG 48.90 = DSM 106950]|nr:VIT1/CCC1 transporter family protein [Stigonema ocellatum SAG 48.90 = DSM 106950]
MPLTPHTERHFTGSETIRDIVIGMSDGLTVPFALAAGLSGAITSTSIIVTAGLAEIIAGSIAMGLGGYLAAKTDSEHYISERRREFREVREMPGEEAQEVADIFRTYGLSDEQVMPVVKAIQANPIQWVDFMMRFELGLEAPEPSRASRSALVIAASYIAGGLVPLAPYMVFSSSVIALRVSAIATLAALYGFGYVKGRFTGTKPIKSGYQTALIGGLAATAAFILAHLFK